MAIGMRSSSLWLYQASTNSQSQICGQFDFTFQETAQVAVEKTLKLYCLLYVLYLYN